MQGGWVMHRESGGEPAPIRRVADAKSAVDACEAAVGGGAR